MEIEENAFIKMVHHNLKYSSNEVLGIFLGKKVDGLLTIFDAVPLFHNPITAPMLELAFVLMEQYAQSKGLLIVGIYISVNTEDVPLRFLQIANKVESNFTGSTLFLIENKPLDLNNFGIPHVYTNKHWLPIGSNKESKSPNESWKIIPKLDDSSIKKSIQNFEFNNINDFDAHLDNPIFDWKNPQYEKL